MSPNPHLVRPDRETLVRLTSEMNDRQISRLFGCTSPVIARWRDLYGIPRSPRQSGGNTTKWKTNRDYFAEIDTPEKAYILGFVIADGHVREEGYKLEISVKESDSSVLEAIARELDCDAPLGSMTNHYDGSRMTRLYLCGKKLVSDLNALGVFHNKTTTATYPVIPHEFERDLVRGLWDGDGHVGQGMFDLIGTPAVLEGVVTAVQRHTGCLLRRNLRGRDGKYLYAYGTRRDAPVLRWMYSDASIALARKVRAASYWYCS
jgi:Staphylococcus phage endonuclease